MMMRNAIPLPFLLKHIETSETPIDLLIAQVVPSVLSCKTYWEKRMPNGCCCSRARRCYFYSCFPSLPIQLTQLTQLTSVQHTSVPRHTVEDTHANTQTQKHKNTKAHTHTCSEQSLRILMWNASYVQKTLQLNLTGIG